VEVFHEANLKRQARFPHHLLTTYTHDTKRSPDVRSRLVALTWMPNEWAAKVHEWREATGGLADAREEYLVYQTLVGAYPISPERLDAYLEKALREGKVNSNWIEPEVEHEAAVQRFARDLLPRLDGDPFVERVRDLGQHVALAQLVLKLTCPGVPDLYQGDELEALALVDPDNRRPVDWELRRRLLEALRGGGEPPRDARKLWATRNVLGLRAERPEAFVGSYEPVEAGDDVVAVVRDGEIGVAVALRPDARLPNVPGENVLDASLGVVVTRM
jgi:(1->4)-alpha-D-glucan 1-alpha-D-glucosylmutase